MELDQSIFLLIGLPIFWISLLLGARFIGSIGKG